MAVGSGGSDTAGGAGGFIGLGDWSWASAETERADERRKTKKTEKTEETEKTGKTANGRAGMDYISFLGANG